MGSLAGLSSIAVVAAVLAVSEARAGELHGQWLHNGSYMILWHKSENVIVIDYGRPRAGMREEGVTEGTRFFDRQVAGNHISGHARLFKGGCAPAMYPVSGTITYYRARIVLRGPAPVFERHSCGTARYEWNANSTLVFTAVAD